jgi:polyisoprenoid-binding protein YceI
MDIAISWSIIHDMSNDTTSPLTRATWRLDPSRSSVEFHVRHFYGLMTVKGRFDRFEGTLDAASRPRFTLVIDADSLDTKSRQRDKHLRSDDFFDVDDHPEVRFEADADALEVGTTKVSGVLYAAGAHIPLDVDLTTTAAGDELDVEAVALADHRELGMTWSPLGILRAPSKLLVRGRLIRHG